MTAEVQSLILPYHIISKNYPDVITGKDLPDNGSFEAIVTSLADESERLKTFVNWPNRSIDPKDLAKAGFYYKGQADVVECYFCGVKGHNWEKYDKPMDDHIKWNENCTFVRANSTEQDGTRCGQDLCGNYGVEILPNSQPENTQPTDLEKLGIKRAEGPSSPDNIIYETRLATFKNWPKSLKQKPAELAAAGFFYLGVGDQTVCFYCAGGLKDWEDTDDPWEQHALWFPKCNYLLLKKSQQFVDSVQNKSINSAAAENIDVKLKPSSCFGSSTITKEPLALNVTEETKKGNLEQSSTLCKICFKNELGVVFLPCGHMVACTDCASALKECAVCRQPLQATVRAFIS